MPDHLVVVVTGSNRGIGQGITTLLAQQNLPQPLTIYATSRIGTNTNIPVSPPNEIIYATLDITSPTSIQSFYEQVLTSHSAIDILINNAAVSHDHNENPENIAQTIRTNYGGTRDMCLAFLAQPTLRPNSRIVNLTSGHNALNTYNPTMQEQICSAATVGDVDKLATAYLDLDAATRPRSSKFSKALINTLTTVLARQHEDILINCCCPGWVDTDMGRQGQGKPPKTLEEGARTAVRLGIGDLGAGGDADGRLGGETERVSGWFYENDSIVGKGWGRGKDWMSL
jgi:carbonyl reductase 1